MTEQVQIDVQEEFVDVPVESYFKVIQTNIDVSAFADRLKANPDDWQYVGLWNATDSSSSIPYGIIPLVVASVPENGVNINDNETMYNTAYYHKYSEVRDWTEQQGYKMLARCGFLALGPGSATEIKSNTGKYYEYKDRYCLVIQGTGLFTIHGQEFPVEQGTLFWFNQSELHADMNIGEIDKWTFVFDVPRVEQPKQDVPPPPDYRGESGEEAVS